MTASIAPIGPAKRNAHAESYRARPQFAVSILKLAVMSLATLGLYQFYWHYQQWKAIKERDREDLSPGWRAFFSRLWAFSLFPRIEEQARWNKIDLQWGGGLLAVAYLLIEVTWRLPSPFDLVGLLSFTPLILVQMTINRLNAALAPEAPKNDEFSGWNIVALVIGAILLFLIAVGSFLPDK